MCRSLGENVRAVVFSVQVAGNNPQPPNFFLGNGDSQLVTLDSGPFSILEGAPGPGFIPEFSGDCEQTAPESFEATGNHRRRATTNMHYHQYFTTVGEIKRRLSMD